MGKLGNDLRSEGVRGGVLPFLSFSAVFDRWKFGNLIWIVERSFWPLMVAKESELEMTIFRPGARGPSIAKNVR